MDEVSVNSLLASRLGALTTQQTDRHEIGWKTDGKATGGVEIPLTLKAGLEAALGRTSNRSTQVVRNEIVQAAFKKLVEAEKADLLIRGGADGVGEQWVTTDTGKQLPSSMLARGRLIEVDVELDVEPIYRVSTLFSSLVGLVENNPTLLHEIAGEGFAQGRAVSEVLRGLLGDLVPLRARVVGYEVVLNAEGQEVLVPKVPRDDIGAKPLFLVGVAEEKLFWKDIRRVLFSKGQYRVLARVARTGIQKEWVPVKLEQLLTEIIPDMGRTLNRTTQTVLGRSGEGRVRNESNAMLAPKLKQFVRLYLEAHAPGARPEDYASVLTKYSEAPDELEVFRAATNELVGTISVEVQPSKSEIARLRTIAAKNAVFVAPDGPDNIAEDRYLDCEIIGIYW